jgi:hypothetical protein
MQFFSTVLALVVLQGATAFAPAANGVTSTSALQSMQGRGEGGNIWETEEPTIVQGGSLRTWSFPAVERVQVRLKTDGRPLQANIDLWQGPDNTPQKMAVYIEDGDMRQFNAIIETPRGQNSVAIRNTGALEFPLAAFLEGAEDGSLEAVTQALAEMSRPETIQGGAIKTYSFAPTVSSVQVLLQTDGRPLNARIELMQGPNNNKQVVEVYTEDGRERPFFVVIDTPGSGNVVRIVNTATMGFPMTASVEPYLIDPDSSDGGDVGSYFILD